MVECNAAAIDGSRQKSISAIVGHYDIRVVPVPLLAGGYEGLASGGTCGQLIASDFGFCCADCILLHSASAYQCRGGARSAGARCYPNFVAALAAALASVRRST